MAYKIQVNEKVAKEVIRIYKDIAGNWGFKVADKFYDKFEFRVGQILKHPQIGRPSKKKSEFRKILVAKRNIMYYRIDSMDIILQSLLNSNIDPRKNPYD
jgi:plasmid stabilization system protein ParE